MKNANPYLNFDGNAREAFDHYRSVFGGEFVTAMTFREFGGEQMGLAGAMLDRIAHIALPLGSSLLMDSDVPRPGDFKVGTNTYFAVETDGADAADRVFPSLAARGSVGLQLQQAQWAGQLGTSANRF